MEKKFHHYWCNMYGPPAVLSESSEFAEEALSDVLKSFGIKFNKRSTQRPNKVEVFENMNAGFMTDIPESTERCSVLKGSQRIEV